MRKQDRSGLTKVLVKDGQAAGLKIRAVHLGSMDSNIGEKQRPDELRSGSVAARLRGASSASDDVVVHGLTSCPTVEKNF